MSYEESEVVCDECGKGIGNGGGVSCQSCWNELVKRIVALEEEIEKIKEEK